MSYEPQRTTAAHGYTQQPPNGDWAPQSSRRVRPIAWIALAVAVAVLVLAGWFAYRTFAPAGAPGAAPDSGIQACRELRDKPLGDKQGVKFSEARYKQMRQEFANSRDTEIRDNGTKMIDIAWQISNNKEAAISYMNPLMMAASGLQTACANHGVFLPTN